MMSNVMVKQKANNMTETFPCSIPYVAQAGQLLLPKGLLPILVKEPREMKAVEAAMKQDRYLGIVQPKSQEANTFNAGSLALYQVGCLGRITTFAENEDEGYYLIIKGLRRFRVLNAKANPHSQGLLPVNYEDYSHDDKVSNEEMPKARNRLLSLLKGYFQALNMDIDWKAIFAASNESLVVSLAMMCPFDPAEKQAILESKSLNERLNMITALIEMEGIKQETAVGMLH
jgi:Lon protease-like protein